MIAAVLTNPHYFTPANDFHTIEVFPTLAEALVALFERYHANGRTLLTAAYLDGTITGKVFPNFGEGTTFECYEVAGALDHRPTEEQAMDAHTGVHTGCWSWRLTLTPDASGKITAAVIPNRG